MPVEEDCSRCDLQAPGYPRGNWGVAANRHPVHEVSSRNHWDAPFVVEVPQPLWPPQDEVTTRLTAVG